MLIDLDFLIPAVITQIINPTAELIILYNLVLYKPFCTFDYLSDFDQFF